MCWPQTQLALLTPGVRAGQPTLAAGKPELAEQLHPTLNDVDLVKTFRLGSKHKATWLCRCTKTTCRSNHIWEATIDSRVRGSGCPFCSGRRACACTCLAAVRPQVASEWDHSGANLPHTPQTVLPSSRIDVHWQCTREPAHKWVQSLRRRTDKELAGCPQCRKEGLQ